VTKSTDKISFLPTDVIDMSQLLRRSVPSSRVEWQHASRPAGPWDPIAAGAKRVRRYVRPVVIFELRSIRSVREVM